jgi:hypothetical protein
MSSCAKVIAPSLSIPLMRASINQWTKAVTVTMVFTHHSRKPVYFRNNNARLEPEW